MMSPFLKVTLRIDRASCASSLAGSVRSVGTPRMRRMRSVSSSWRIGRSWQLVVRLQYVAHAAEQALAEALGERIVIRPHGARYLARIDAELGGAVFREDPHRAAAMREDLANRVL